MGVLAEELYPLLDFFVPVDPPAKSLTFWGG